MLVKYYQRHFKSFELSNFPLCDCEMVFMMQEI